MTGSPLIYDLYPSKPLESWDKAKELRRKLFWDIWHGKEEGKILVQGVNIFADCLPGRTWRSSHGRGGA